MQTYNDIQPLRSSRYLYLVFQIADGRNVTRLSVKGCGVQTVAVPHPLVLGASQSLMCTNPASQAYMTDKALSLRHHKLAIGNA